MNFLDPVKIFGEEGYAKIIELLVNSLKNGILTRILSGLFLILSLWFIWRRKQPMLGFAMIALSAVFMFVHLFI
ncbi:MAG: hypothetical protein LBH05_06565 [Deferribacteraceae bacterium]|nr:hypothetical protein [Deferribacteraceae bacterium]